jgi:hypothetical protein
MDKDLLSEAGHAWKSAVLQKTWLSPLHKAVSLTLWKLGIVHQDNLVTADGLFCVDIALEGTNVRLSLSLPVFVFSVNVVNQGGAWSNL